MLIIGVIVLIFVGPNEIPELARVVGKFLNELRRAKDSLSEEFSKSTDGLNVKNILKDVKDDLNKEVSSIEASVKDHVFPNAEPGTSGENGPSYPPSPPTSPPPISPVPAIDEPKKGDS